MDAGLKRDLILLAAGGGLGLLSSFATILFEHWFQHRGKVQIQGVLALENSFNRLGLDHVILVKVASTALATHLLGGTRGQIIDALSQVTMKWSPSARRAG